MRVNKNTGKNVNADVFWFSSCPLSDLSDEGKVAWDYYQTYIYAGQKGYDDNIGDFDVISVALIKIKDNPIIVALTKHYNIVPLWPVTTLKCRIGNIDITKRVYRQVQWPNWVVIRESSHLVNTHHLVIPIQGSPFYLVIAAGPHYHYCYPQQFIPNPWSYESYELSVTSEHGFISHIESVNNVFIGHMISRFSEFPVWTSVMPYVPLPVLKPYVETLLDHLISGIPVP